MKGFLILFIFICGVSSVCADEVLQTALKSIGLQRADLTIASTTLDDPDRLWVTRHLLEEPVQIPQIVRMLSGQTLDEVLTGGDVLMGFERGYQVDIERQTFDEWVDELVVCQSVIEQLLAPFDAHEREQLNGLMALVDPGVVITESKKDTLIALGRRVPVAQLIQLGRRVIHIAEGIYKSDLALATGRFETAAGWAVIGTPGADVYEESAILILDPGGDDVYRNDQKNAISLQIDLAGNDVYHGNTGLGILGIDVVIDHEGDDRYEGEGIGCGIAGLGVVVDQTGDDVYQSKVGAQGFGLYGIGILYDGGGADHYVGGHLVQGAAGPGGLGILADVAGKDVYEAGNLYRDFREEGTFFQSMAQGFGRGVRPLTSGGIGVLIDNDGDDVYRVGYFGQGAAFWGGCGFLIDRKGDDQYGARRYAQGAGVHVSVGALVDLKGNDLYDLWGVGQGCGHDMSVGALLDHGGADQYRATWLAQGAGSANGIGWLDDGGGNDQYQVKREDTQGFGVLSRDYGSIGLFIDRAGQDTYDGQGATGLLWRSGQHGVGVDWPLELKKR